MVVDDRNHGWQVGIGGLGGSRYVPMVVFFVAFFFGHKFCEPSRVYWFDKLCVDQADEALKRQQVARSIARPNF